MTCLIRALVCPRVWRLLRTGLVVRFGESKAGKRILSNFRESVDGMVCGFGIRKEGAVRVQRQALACFSVQLSSKQADKQTGRPRTSTHGF